MEKEKYIPKIGDHIALYSNWDDCSTQPIGYFLVSEYSYASYGGEYDGVHIWLKNLHSENMGNIFYGNVNSMYTIKALASEEVMQILMEM